MNPPQGDSINRNLSDEKEEHIQCPYELVDKLQAGILIHISRFNQTAKEHGRRAWPEL